MDKKFFVSKEKYLELKEIQKKIAKGREVRQHYQVFIKARQFYHSKGQQVPAIVYEPNEISFPERTPLVELGAREARYVNIIYGLVKGKQYPQIERKVRDGNEVDNFYLERYCNKYGVDFVTVKGLVWQQTQSSK